MKNGFYFDLNRNAVLRGARRCMALLLALLLLVPANLATVLAEGTAGAQETRTLRYVGNLAPHKHTKDCRNKDGKLVCGIVEGEYYHEHNQYCRDEAGNLVCGLQEKRPHHHTDSCYKEEKTLVCGLEETAGHQHGEGCYTEKKELTCGLEETAGHQHGADCYTRTLTCGLEETAGHQHGEGCYERRLTCTEEHEHTADCPHEDVLVCGKAEGEGAHAHTDACYTDALICGKAEGEGAHAHGDACYTVTRELTCGKAEGEGAHAHTDDCWKTSKVLTCTEGEPVVIDGVTFRIQTLTSSASDWQEEVVEAAPAEEETAEEEADAEENIEQEPAAEEAAAEESTVEDTVTEDPAAEETTAEETVEEEPVEETIEEATEAEEAADEGEEMPSEPAGTEDRTFEYAIPGAQEVALSEVFAALGVVADGEWADFAAGIEAVEVSNPEALWLEETEGDWTLRAMREPEAGDALTAALADGSKITVEITAYGDTEASAKNDAVVISTVDDMYLPEEAAAEAVMPAAEEAPAQMLDVPDPGEDAESVCRVFDIELANVDAQEYEGFDVAVNLDEDVVGADFKLYQVQGDVATDLTDTLELNSQVGADGLESVSGFTFRTDDFAQFVLCYSLETYYKTVEGETFKITVNFDEAAQIPFGAELKVREIEPGEADFQRYLDDSAAQLGVQSADVTFARFFDIEIVKDGEKVEPKAPVQVTIAYQDALELGEEDQLNVVHFADAGTEVISDVSVTDDGTQITYEQDSFSVTGTVVTNPSASSGGTQHYALIVEYNGKYYSVRNDGTLNEVEYSEETNKATVKMDYPVLWTYASKSVGGNVTGQGNQTVNVLQLESSAAHIGAYAQPDDWYFYYIDPTSDGAITEEPTCDTSERAAAQHPTYQWQCSVDYTGNKLRSHRNSSLYIGVDGDNFRIKGNASQAEAATVYFAEVDSVPASANLNHTVNHIDISVRGQASLTVPLAYGDYTYVDETGEPRHLHINKPTDLELVSDVPITIDDMKRAEITAYSSQNGILDNAFYITGYSQNNSSENNQVRIEGSFKVSDLARYNDSNLDRSKDPAIDKDSWGMTPKDECQIKDADLTKRKDNRIYYTLTVNKDLEFKWIYKDANGHYGQLMDSSGKLLSSTISVNLSKSFDYWDEANECPPVYPKSGVGNSDDVAKWQKGHILWDTHAKSGSGMDFVLDIKNKSDPNVVALEITKHIMDDKGNLIHPQLPVSNQFVVYQKTGANQADWASVATLGGETPDYKNYHGIHTKSIIVGESGEGMVNDFDVKEGMAYIEEDADSVPGTITDTAGRTWVYSTTRNETEYVWRKVDKPADVHSAEGFISIPEIIGNYGTYQEDGQDKPLFNGFLEFDVYNVYMPSASKKEVNPYVGTGTLGPVKVGQEITYEISYTNYKDAAATITIEDPLDPNVEFVSASDKGAEKDGVVTWTLEGVAAGAEGTVSLTVKVLEGALKSNGGEGKVVNGGDGAVVSIDNEYAFTLEPVENPVIGKRETAPYEGTGVLGGVKVGDEITYEIEYKNYKAEAADVVIVDTLDTNVKYISSSDNGSHTGGVVTWTLSQVPAGESGTVTLTVEVLEGALKSNGGPAKVVNGGENATVQVGNDKEYTLNEVENPVPEVPQKKETAPYEGTGVLGGVKVGDEITYEISYKNYKAEAADIVIKDTLDTNVKYISSSDNGGHTGEQAGGVVTWTLKDVEAGEDGTVTLTVKVLEGALDSKGGEGKVVNGGENATVKVGNDNEYTLNEVENPVPEVPQKKETAPYEGTGVLGGVKVGDEITYEISYKNYKAEAADIVIKDTLDAHVQFVGASNGGAEADGVVTWTLKDVAAGKEGTVTLKVRVLEGALESKGGEGKVVNGGDTATVKVGEDHEYTLNEVENPVPEPPEKKETVPYVGTKALGAVKLGDAITYTITYKNYKADAADVVIRDTLDTHVQFVSASNGGVYEDGTVKWTIADVPSDEKGSVTLTVQVLDTALESHKPTAGPGKVVNGGDTATVQVGNDHEFKLNTVENPVPEPPHKQEIVPEPPTGSDGTGVLGAVQVGDTITYKISYRNYKNTAADVVIKDKLDDHVALVSAENGGVHSGGSSVTVDGTQMSKGGTVTWTLNNVAPTAKDADDLFVTLTVKVLGSAKVPDGPGMVVNGGDTATVKVGNDNEYSLEKVVNPVLPSKQEVLPYQGLDDLGAVKVGDEITYEINYVNYTPNTANIVIKDTLDPNVTYVSSDPTGLLDGNTVKWTIESVKSGDKGSVRLTVKVLDTALKSHNPAGPGKVANGSNKSASIEVGNEGEIYLNEVENPVPEPPHKQEIAPYEGNGELGAVQVGSEITYEIRYRNYKTDKADIVIADTLDKNVEFVSASDSGWNDNGVVRWTLKDVAASTEGTVSLTVKVLDTALESKRGPGKVVNGGENATVKVGNDNVFTLEEVSNPVPESPEKQETAPTPPAGTEGKGLLDPVKVGDQITYTIRYKNYKSTAATVVIKDTLDKNVKFVSAGDATVGTTTKTMPTGEAGGQVVWTVVDVPAGKTDSVTLTVEVLPSAQVPEGPGKVVNGGKDATVKVGDDMEFKLDTVENPVPPVKRETAPYDQTKGKEPGAVKVGDEITYKIFYANYLNEAAPIVIEDKLDANVKFVSASDEGKETNGTVEWTIADVPAGEKGFVTLTVEVQEGALESKGGGGKVVNGGEGTTVKVGDHHEYTLEPVENPVPEEPVKQETAPYNQAKGEEPGAVKVGDVITYTISYRNYKAEAADIVITDKLDENVEFISAEPLAIAVYDKAAHTVTWTFEDEPHMDEDSFVTLTVKVLEGALESKRGPGKVVNGGEGATVKVGNDQEYTLNEVENPVPETPTKQETAPYDQTKDQKLGAVKVGDEITYTISYTNYKKTDATVTIVDTLDKNVEFVEASTGSTYKDKNDTDTQHTVTWTLENVKPGMSGTVTLTVKVLEGALESKNGPGKVVNGGGTASVQVDNDQAYTLNQVENPVPEPPEKKEITPYEGTGVLGGVKVGEKITYEISYRNYNSTGTADIVIVDKLDGHVAFSKASDGGEEKNGVVTWKLEAVPAGKAGKVTLTVVVLEGALQSMGGKGKVVNGGENATVKVGNDNAYTLNEVENPVPEPPEKKEITPFEGTGLLGAVKAGQEITYEIAYKNYKAEKADIVITDTLDRNVEFVSASDDGAETGGVVTWKLENVAAGKAGKVTLTVKVLESAEVSNGGPGKVINGGDTATVQVGEDHEYTLNTVVNPLLPQKQETEPYEGNGVLGGVKVGEEITYEIFYANYLDEAAEIVIKDTLDKNVEFVDASDKGVEADGIVTWTLDSIDAGKTGKVTLTVKVLEGALESNGGPGKVVNGGDNATVKVGNDQEYTLNEVENPVPEVPNKQEIKPYEGNGVLGGVKVGEEITYEISYRNYKADAADIVIKDTLDKNVEFVSASDGGSNADGVVTWTLKAVPAGEEGTVTLTVKVLESALESSGGPAKVVNGGENATVKVGEDHEYTLNEVENPVPEVPNKQEIKPYEGNGVLGGVKVGDEITYEISYKNYKTEKADIVIVDTLDKNVEFVDASDDGEEAEGVVTWTLKDVDAGKTGKVTLTVKVLEGALQSMGGKGKVVNGGDNATVKVGNDQEYTLNEVENPVPEQPNKQEVKPYKGNGVLGGVKVGEEITYEIAYKNYKAEKADIVITDTLDKNVKFVSASDDGAEKNGVVTWTLKDVAAGKEGTVTLTVKVLEGALESNGGPGKVVNGGENATVKVGEDHEYTLNEVENPVPEVPNKQEVKPYKGNGVLGAVKVGDTITYEIRYKNYKAEKADIVITDTLDRNVEFVSASDDGEEKDGVVTWTLKGVDAGQTGKVTLTVKVLEGALESNGGPGKVVNGGDNATVKVGNDNAYTLNEVENPVPEQPNKQEVKPYKGNGVLGGVKVGEEITYEIRYKNYKAEKADIVITDTLDRNVQFVSASDGGKNANGVVTWTLKGVEAGKESAVTLTAKVLKGALKSNGGPAKVVNGGENATVKVGDDPAYTLNEVENPVPEAPNKREVKPYKGTGKLGAVNVGDTITYEISYKNYKAEKADIVIKDTLDKHVKFVSASDGGVKAKGVVTWTLKDVEAGKEGTVTLTVKVLEGARKSNKGPGKVVNGGDNATVQVGNDNAYTLNEVENPVSDPTTGDTTTTTTQTTTLTGHKIWDDEGDVHGLRPQSITLQLLADGTPVNATPEWSDTDTDDWTFTYKNLRTTTGAGITIHYTVQEVPVEGYECEIDGMTITNHLIPREPENYVNLSGVKTWEDDDDAEGKRPEGITVRLYRDGQVIDVKRVTGADGWKYSFGRLPADDGFGKVFTYTLREDGVEGYYARYNGMNVTNTLLPETPEKEPIVRKGTPRPDFSKLTETMWDELLALLGYDTPLFGMLATGDETPVYPYVFGGVGALAVLAWLMLERRKRRAAKQ